MPQNNVIILVLSEVFSAATPPPQKQTGLNLKLEKQVNYFCLNTYHLTLGKR